MPLSIAFTHLQALFNECRKRMLTPGLEPIDGQHNEAVLHPTKWPEVALVAMLHAWALYASCYEKAYLSEICHDGVCGSPWFDIGLALRQLLNCESGRLDCGTLDTFIQEEMKRNGFTAPK